ncbi:MAG: helix-turn-helix domain-containing protein [Pirellulaceae bacterium]
MPNRRPNRHLIQLFEQSPLAIYVVDAEREIVYCNAACATWFGIDASKLVGQTCQYHSGEGLSPASEAATAMCPPPPVFLGHRATGTIVWRLAGGTVEQRAAFFLPLAEGDDESHSILAVLDVPRPLEAQPASQSDTATSQDLHERLQQLTRQQRLRYKLDRLVGDSLAMRRVREQVELAMAGRPRVLIIGPSGSGRSHIARTIHVGDNPDKAGPLLPLFCRLLDRESLQAAILDFLRRTQDHPARQSAAVLLHNVDELAVEAQAELQAFFRIPSFAVRTLATAERPLLPCQSSREFLPELAYILSSLTIEVPPLCERREDIPLLAQRFVEDFNAVSGKQLAGFSPAALDRLAALPWQGNVEELATTVDEACRRVTTVWIGEADLPDRIRAIVSAGLHPRRTAEPIRLDSFLLEVEKELITRAMRRTKGNKAKAARMLGVSRQRLLRRLVQLGLETPPAPEIDFQPVDDDSAPASEP